MSAFTRQLSAAQRQHDNASPDESGDARDEWINERATALADEYRRDSQKVSDSLSHFFTLGAGDVLEAALLRFYMGFDGRSNEAMAAAGLELFKTLDGQVSQDVKEQAELDAERERDRWEDEQAEMRNGGLEDAA